MNSELEKILQFLKISGVEFLHLCGLSGMEKKKGKVDKDLAKVMLAFANSMVAIHNLSIRNDELKEGIEAINLRLDLANCPRDITENSVIDLRASVQNALRVD